jgi:hypothetical protein
MNPKKRKAEKEKKLIEQEIEIPVVTDGMGDDDLIDDDDIIDDDENFEITESEKLDGAIKFVVINILYRREELIPKAVGVWEIKYRDELQLFEYILLKLLSVKLGREPEQVEIDDCFLIEKIN